MRMVSRELNKSCKNAQADKVRTHTRADQQPNAAGSSEPPPPPPDQAVSCAARSRERVTKTAHYARTVTMRKTAERLPGQRRFVGLDGDHKHGAATPHNAKLCRHATPQPTRHATATTGASEERKRTGRGHTPGYNGAHGTAPQSQRLEIKHSAE